MKPSECKIGQLVEWNGKIYEIVSKVYEPFYNHYNDLFVTAKIDNKLYEFDIEHLSIFEETPTIKWFKHGKLIKDDSIS